MLSVVICTKNEEKNIARCLISALSVADEIVIVDSLSTDNTSEICRSYPLVRFHQMPWEGFSQTKNKANLLAQYNWILSLDADEELSPELQSELKTLKALGFKGAYQLNRLSNYCGHWVKHSGWFPDRKIRLFSKKDSRWVGDFVHEELQLSANSCVTDLKGLLFHYSVTSYADHLKKVRSYSALGAERVAQKKPFVVIALSLCLNPFFRFLRHYFLKLGFLDGRAGFLISLLSAYSVFLKYRQALKIKLS